jgi:hypothetical protein
MHCRFILIPRLLMVFMVWGWGGGWIIESIIVTGTPWTVSYNSAMVPSALCMVLLSLFIYAGFMLGIIMVFLSIQRGERVVREKIKVRNTHSIRLVFKTNLIGTS